MHVQINKDRIKKKNYFLFWFNFLSTKLLSKLLVKTLKLKVGFLWEQKETCCCQFYVCAAGWWRCNVCACIFTMELWDVLYCMSATVLFVLLPVSARTFLKKRVLNLFYSWLTLWTPNPTDRIEKHFFLLKKLPNIHNLS